MEQLRRIVYDRSGILLRENKEAMVSARLNKRMRMLGLADSREYLQYLHQDATGDELVRLIDAIATNVTRFFREPDHFLFLGEVARRWVSEGQKKMRFWSSACSTGEEPYSMVMTLLEAVKGHPVDIRVLATDISTRVLESCRDGVYKEETVEAVPAALRNRYLWRIRDGKKVTYRVREELKGRVVFKWLNLSRPPFPMRGPLDAILCRNVIIYFDDRVRRNLMEEFFRLLKPGGYLIVGHAESLSGRGTRFEVVRPSIYVKN